MLKQLAGKPMNIDEDVYLAETSVIVGDVTLRSQCSIWYGAVLRGDCGMIIIGSRSNIQDQVTVHETTIVGHDVTVGHNAILHGCTIEPYCLIGMHSTVLDHAVIGEGSIVAAGCLVTRGMIVPPGSVVMGVPGKIVGKVPPDFKAQIKSAAEEYLSLAEEQLEKAGQ